MVRLAIQGQSMFDICVAEGKITGRPSYTIDTVRLFRDAGYKDVYWLMGADNIERSKRWHKFDELRRECKFLVMKRPGYEIDPATLKDHNCVIMDAPTSDISSTDIRLKVKLGKDITSLTPKAVADYIAAKNLYAVRD